MVCSHSPPTFIVWRPFTHDTLSFNCTRHRCSSTPGCRKNGLPNRNVGPNPIPVSEVRFDSTALRGRSSRE